MKGTGAKRNVCRGSCVSTGAKFPVAPVESAPMFRPALCFIFVYNCGLTVRNKRICYVMLCYVSPGLMPTEAPGNYFPEAPYLRETKTYRYLNYMHASESTLDSGTASHSSRHDMLAVISSRYQYGPFLFVVAEVMSSYLTTDGLKKNFSTSGGPLRPEARGICHICHMVNPALGRYQKGKTNLDFNEATDSEWQ